MIVEGYTADVYCDHPDHPYPDHPYREPGCVSTPAVFYARNKRQTDKMRRAAGWVKRGGKDYCPGCRPPGNYFR